MSEATSLSQVLMQITDGHPGSAAERARESKQLNAAERVVLTALLRLSRENALKARVDSHTCKT